MEEDDAAPRIVHPKKDEWDVYVCGRWKDLLERGIVHFPWANPYWKTFPGAVNKTTPEEAVRLYEKHVRDRPDLWRRLDELRGKRLACWCSARDPACHAVVLCKLVMERDARRRLVQRKIRERSETSTVASDALRTFEPSRRDDVSHDAGDDLEDAEPREGLVTPIEAILSFSENVETLLRWRRVGGEPVRRLLVGPRGIVLARRALGDEYRWLSPGQAIHDAKCEPCSVRSGFSGATPGRALSEGGDRKLLDEQGAFRFRPATWWCDLWHLGEPLDLPPLEITWVRGEADRSWAVRTGEHGALFHEFTASTPTRQTDGSSLGPPDPLSSLLQSVPLHCDPYRAWETYATQLADVYGRALGIPDPRSQLLGGDGHRFLCDTDGFSGDQEIVTAGFYSFRVRLALVCHRPDDPAAVSQGPGSSPQHFRLGWLVSQAKLVSNEQDLGVPFRFVLAMGLLDRSG